MNRAVVLGVTVAALVSATVLTWIDVRQQREFRRLIASGDAALARDQTIAAIEAFSGAMALRRTSMLPYLKRGDTYRRRGDFEAALRDLTRAAALDPMAPRPVELLGDVTEALGQHQRAIGLYNRYIALDDRAPRVLYKLATAEYRDGRRTAAIDSLRKALAIDQKFAEAHELLGVCLRADGRTDQALGSLTRAVGLNPTLETARLELADLYDSLGRRRDEIEQLEAFAALVPDRPDALIRVGMTYARMERTDAAVLTLTRAAERFPENAATAVALARVWLDVADARDDTTAVRKAVDVLRPVATRPDAPSEALALYGRALLTSGDAREAEQILQQATSRSPMNASTLMYLARAAGRLRHAAIEREAKAEYEALVR
jgi:tetratricopeptide (TPR) repeat protein